MLTYSLSQKRGQHSALFTGKALLMLSALSVMIPMARGSDKLETFCRQQFLLSCLLNNAFRLNLFLFQVGRNLLNPVGSAGVKTFCAFYDCCNQAPVFPGIPTQYKVVNAGKGCMIRETICHVS